MISRNGFVFQFSLVVESLERLISQVSDLPPEFWQAQPAGRFGPGEILVHLMQSGHFVSRFVREQLELDPRTPLEPYFAKAVNNREALSALNLRGARKVCGSFTTTRDFRDWLYAELKDIEHSARSIPEFMLEKQVSHPLVEMKGPCGQVLLQLLVVHLAYHLGQLTEQIKVAGYPVPYLPIFGSFGEQAKQD